MQINSIKTENELTEIWKSYQTYSTLSIISGLATAALAISAAVFATLVLTGVMTVALPVTLAVVGSLAGAAILALIATSVFNGKKIRKECEYTIAQKQNEKLHAQEDSRVAKQENQRFQIEKQQAEDRAARAEEEAVRANQKATQAEQIAESLNQAMRGEISSAHNETQQAKEGAQKLKEELERALEAQQRLTQEKEELASRSAKQAAELADLQEILATFEAKERALKEKDESPERCGESPPTAELPGNQIDAIQASSPSVASHSVTISAGGERWTIERDKFPDSLFKAREDINIDLSKSRFATPEAIECLIMILKKDYDPEKLKNNSPKILINTFQIIPEFKDNDLCNDPIIGKILKNFFKAIEDVDKSEFNDIKAILEALISLFNNERTDHSKEEVTTLLTELPNQLTQEHEHFH